MTDLLPERRRLDSWKAIAGFLKRDLATVRRWEKGLGLPVHRVGGSGRSVFAYVSEIEAWLETARPAIKAPSIAAAGASRTMVAFWAGAVLSLIIAGLIAAL